MATYQEIMNTAKNANATDKDALLRKALVEKARRERERRQALSPAEAEREERLREIRRQAHERKQSAGLNQDQPANANDAELNRIRAEAARRKQQGTQETGFRDQTMSGVNEGIAQALGFPVDAATGAINGMTGLVNRATGTNIPSIAKPFLGTESITGFLDPVISDAEPQTRPQMYGRRIGQELGATAPFALGAAGAPGRVGNMARSSLPKYAETEVLGALGAGTGAAIAEDIAPGSMVAELTGQALGGGIGVGSSYARSPSPQAPTIDDLRARQSEAYGRVDTSQTRLTPHATDALQQNIKAKSARDGMDSVLAPLATRRAEQVGNLQTPTIGEVEKMRRFMGRLAGNNNVDESTLGMGMKKEITNYLDGLSAEDVTGGNPDATVAALREGRDMTRRIKASETVDDALGRGQRRAATSGTGGNEVNAIRQNLRSILDSPKKRAGFTADELSAMEDIVMGTPSQNAMRLLGRLSPTAGALPTIGGLGATGAFGPLGAVPSAIGMGAKGLAERSTQQGVSALQELIRNGAPVGRKQLQDAEKSAIASLLAAHLSGAYSSQ